MNPLFLSLTIAIILAASLGILAKALKQPPLIGYIVAGIILGTFISSTQNIEFLDLFSTLGISLLLFIVGLQLNPKVLKKLGTVSLALGLIQMLVTGVLGFFLLKLLNFSTSASIYVAIALTFSSTIIIVKLLTDKNSIDSLYGRIAIGILIVQDVVAIFTLMFLSGYQNSLSVSLFFITIIKGIILAGFIFLFSRFILPRLFKFISNSSELLFVLGITWSFTAALLFSYFGFSIEIGAFLAGISLSFLPYNSEIISKITPLRDFFLIIFFVVLGLHVELSNLTKLIIPALIISIFILIVKPIIFFLLMWFFGYTRRTSFLLSTSMAQISEFSLIVIGLAATLSLVSKEIISLVTLVGLITIMLSTYLIINGSKIYDLIEPALSIFERRIIKEDELSSHSGRTYETVVIGAHRTSYYILKKLKQLKQKFLVVEFDPDQTEKLKSENIHVLFGDVADSAIIEKIKFFNPKMIISTIKDYEDNKLLLEIFKNYNEDIVFVALARNFSDLEALYSEGADLIILPEAIAGHQIAAYMDDIRKVKAAGRQYYEHMMQDKEKSLLN
jgi:Kef-type K+ transport system membrane component KefB